MQGNKEKTTLSIDKKVKKDFKIECTIHSIDMSETVESFMLSFTNNSRKQRLNEPAKG